MGLEGAGEGVHESGGTSGTSEGRDNDRGNETSGRSTVPELSESRFARGSYTAPDNMGDTGAKYGTGAIGTYKDVKVTGVVKGFVNAVLGIKTGNPIGGIKSAISGIKVETTEKNLSDVFHDPNANSDRSYEGHEANNFFNHNFDQVLVREQQGNIAAVIQPNVTSDPYINFNSLGPMGVSGDASSISPGSNLAVSEQDNSWILIAAAAALLI